MHAKTHLEPHKRNQIGTLATILSPNILQCNDRQYSSAVATEAGAG